ncbi:MAG: hypothetical protein Kow0029_03970 [Candidatus Rifleibacteriota bacterium]
MYGGNVKDPETASHDFDAAKYVVEAVYEGNGFQIVQFRLGVLSHYSYLLISDGKVLVVDPGRDVETYLKFAEEKNLEWVGTFLTHSHADFVAGHQEMARATGSPIFVSHAGGNMFTHVAVKEGEKIQVGNAVINVLETPGHTPDGLCGLVSNRQTPDKGQFLLSGDTLFVGSVGRPDLMGGILPAASLAKMMFDTWNNKLAKLDDDVIILPAHGAGSLCGANLSEEPFSSIRQEKISNPYLELANDRSAFVARVLNGLSEAPAYFKENATINRKGPGLVDWQNPLGEKVTDIDSLRENPDVYFIDIRDPAKYAAGHIKGSINIALRGRLETWVGIVAPFKSRVILIGDELEVLEASRRLKRVGYNADYLDFSVNPGRLASPMFSPEELYQRMKQKNEPLIVDVRLPNEWMGTSIGEVLNLPLNLLASQAPAKLCPDDELVTVCNSAFRSGMAVGILERVGFKKVRSLKGGTEAWIKAGYPVVKIKETVTKKTIAKSFRDLGLPQRISAEFLLNRLKDMPDSLEIVDIRPVEQVKSYNPLNAQPVDLGDLLEDRTWLVGDVPLVIVDRDGTLALMAGGILSRKTDRKIMVLVGGVEAVWRKKELNGIRDIMIPEKPFEQKVTPEKDGQGSRAKPEKPADPAVKKRKSAGC